jgi:hypothetical protein
MSSGYGAASRTHVHASISRASSPWPPQLTRPSVAPPVPLLLSTTIVPLARTCSVAVDTPPGKKCRSLLSAQSHPRRMHLCSFPVLLGRGPGPLRLHLSPACLRPYRHYTHWSEPHAIPAPYHSYSTFIREPSRELHVGCVQTNRVQVQRSTTPSPD